MIYWLWEEIHTSYNLFVRIVIFLIKGKWIKQNESSTNTIGKISKRLEHFTLGSILNNLTRLNSRRVSRLKLRSAETRPEISTNGNTFLAGWHAVVVRLPAALRGIRRQLVIIQLLSAIDFHQFCFTHRFYTNRLRLSFSMARQLTD